VKIIVTNNPLVKEQVGCIYLENQDYLAVLIAVRDLIQQNYQLLTHPLSSNFLADKTIYKTVVLQSSDCLNLQSIELIENAIILVRDSLLRRDPRIFEDSIKADLQFIDYEIIKQTLK
jgi:hypothetical protein